MFFKTNNTEVVGAFNSFNNELIALRAAADEFAKEYDATAVILGDSDSAFFGGIKFNNNIDINRGVWRAPDRSYGTSFLRVKPTKKEFKEEFDKEVAKWETLKAKHFPNGWTIKKDKFYKTLGFDWGDLFLNSFNCFERKGFLYIDTGISKVANHAVEILGSEYLNASNLNYEDKKKADAAKASSGENPICHRLTASGAYEIGHFGPAGFVKNQEVATLAEAKQIIEAHNAKLGV